MVSPPADEQQRVIAAGLGDGPPRSSLDLRSATIGDSPRFNSKIFISRQHSDVVPPGDGPGPAKYGNAQLPTRAVPSAIMFGRARSKPSDLPGFESPGPIYNPGDGRAFPPVRAAPKPLPRRFFSPQRTASGAGADRAALSHSADLTFEKGSVAGGGQADDSSPSAAHSRSDAAAALDAFMGRRNPSLTLMSGVPAVSFARATVAGESNRVISKLHSATSGYGDQSPGPIYKPLVNGSVGGSPSKSRGFSFGRSSNRDLVRPDPDIPGPGAYSPVEALRALPSITMADADFFKNLKQQVRGSVFEDEPLAEAGRYYGRGFDLGLGRDSPGAVYSPSAGSSGPSYSFSRATRASPQDRADDDSSSATAAAAASPPPADATRKDASSPSPSQVQQKLAIPVAAETAKAAAAPVPAVKGSQFGAKEKVATDPMRSLHPRFIGKVFSVENKGRCSPGPVFGLQDFQSIGKNASPKATFPRAETTAIPETSPGPQYFVRYSQVQEAAPAYSFGARVP